MSDEFIEELGHLIGSCEFYTGSNVMATVIIHKPLVDPDETVLFSKRNTLYVKEIDDYLKTRLLGKHYGILCHGKLIQFQYITPITHHVTYHIVSSRPYTYEIANIHGEIERYELQTTSRVLCLREAMVLAHPEIDNAYGSLMILLDDQEGHSDDLLYGKRLRYVIRPMLVVYIHSINFLRFWS